MKLATTTGDFSAYTQSQIQALEWIRQSGFRWADYNFGMDYNSRSGIYSADPEGYLKKVNAAAENMGISLIQAHAPMGKPLDPAEEEFRRDTFLCIRACEAMGIENLVVHSGYAVGITKEECFRRNRDFFLPLLEEGEKRGVNVLVENFNKMTRPNELYWVDNAPDLAELIRFVNHPRFHAVWDTGHGNLQEMPQHEALGILGKEVFALHVQDNMGIKDAHTLPLSGSTSMDDVMQGLLAIDYRGYFTFEATRIFLPARSRRPHDGELRLATPPLSLRLAAEKLLYETGKAILSAYDVYEE